MGKSLILAFIMLVSLTVGMYLVSMVMDDALPAMTRIAGTLIGLAFCAVGVKIFMTGNVR